MRIGGDYYVTLILYTLMCTYIYIYRFVYLIISFILPSVIGIFICKGKRSHFLSITIDGRIEVRNKSSFSLLYLLLMTLFSVSKNEFSVSTLRLCVTAVQHCFEFRRSRRQHFVPFFFLFLTFIFRYIRLINLNDFFCFYFFKYFPSFFIRFSCNSILLLSTQKQF